MYTIEELSFILYNNRSVNGVVKNFIPKDINPFKLNDIENKLDHYKKIYNDQKFVEINRNEIDETCEDIHVTPITIQNLTNMVKLSHLNLCGKELEYLLNRGITQDIISQWFIGGMSLITDYKDLEILNATCHPVLKPILEDGLEDGGIIIPLFRDDLLINCAIRKLSDIGKLKYSLACPDIDVWGLDDIEGEEVWITEGLFDMMALRSIGLKSVSVSSAMWSGIQLYKLLEKKPKSIIIFCDNDNVGLKTGLILHKFFNINGIYNKTVISSGSKDASEHVFQNKLGLDDIKDIRITMDMIDNLEDNYNFIKYLKNRKF
jgi:5S rRNA maturation endonuclease (ribonuclease M5)